MHSFHNPAMRACDPRSMAPAIAAIQTEISAGRPVILRSLTTASLKVTLDGLKKQGIPVMMVDGVDHARTVGAGVVAMLPVAWSVVPPSPR